MINITSPEASFLNFNYVDTNSCDDEADIALPVCGDLSIKAQINVETNIPLETVKPLYIAVCDADCNVLIDNDTQVQPICSEYSFKTTIEGEIIGPESVYSLCNEEYKTPFQEFNFANNPFNEIYSADLTFDFHHYMTGEDEVQLQLYIQNKVYIIEWSTILSSPYTIQVADNVNFVKIKHYLSPHADSDSLLNFFTSVIDVNHGSTSSESGGTFTVALIPGGSYINNNAFVDNPNTISTVNEVGKFFYWNNAALHYTALGSSTNTISYKYFYYLTGGQGYSIKYIFNSLYTNFSGNITLDDGVNPATVVPFSINDYSGEIEAILFGSGGSYNITINITNTNGHLNGFNIETINMYETPIFDVYASTSGPEYVTIPLGQYSKSSLIDKISELLGFIFDCSFTSCCGTKLIRFSADFGEGVGISADYDLTEYWNKGYIDFPAVATCDTTYRYNYQYVAGNTWDFDYCTFTNAYFTEIYVEGDPTNYGGVYITDQDELWSGIMGAWGGTTYPICIDIDTNIVYPEITLTVDDPEFGISKFKMRRVIASNTCVDCFTYCILDNEKHVIACSNQFQVTTDCCYVSKLEYGNNEDAFGFSYPAGVTNTIQLPFFIHSPKHLTKEKVYRRTDGTYRRLSADIEKEYTCETDYFKEYLHDRLIVALKHDNVTVTSNRLNITESVSQQGDYSMDWNAKIDFTAKAEFKLRTYFNGKNNNCGGSCN